MVTRYSFSLFSFKNACTFKEKAFKEEEKIVKELISSGMITATIKESTRSMEKRARSKAAVLLNLKFFKSLSQNFIGMFTIKASERPKKRGVTTAEYRVPSKEKTLSRLRTRPSNNISSSPM